MEKIYLVSKNTRGRAGVPLYAFSSMKKAETFCINYLYNHSTLEDRTYNKIEKIEYSSLTEFSLYTNEYGNIDLCISRVNYE